MSGFRSTTFTAAILLFVSCAAPDETNWRTIEFETTEVTAPDVAISPDGEWLIFTMLGHLFRVPVGGGEAAQLTFGPYHDMDPAVSPDGNRVAFGSNRDGTDGNIFVLNLADGRIQQVTHDGMAGRPTWAPDQSAIAYLRRHARSFHCPSGRAGVVRVSMDGRQVEQVVGNDVITSVFYMPDGRLAWSAIEPSWPRTSTRIDALIADGSVETLDTLSGAMGRVLADATGNGFYGRGYPRGASDALPSEHLTFHGLASDEDRQIATLTMPPCHYLTTVGFAVAPTDDAVYLGEEGGLWKYSVRDGVRESIPFRAKITLQVRDPIVPRAVEFPAPGDHLASVGIMSPTLSPSGEYLVFGAIDHVWLQATDGGSAQRLVDGHGHERQPVLSPDGRHLLFLASDAWRQHVRLLDLETREMQTLATGVLHWDPSWSPDGRRVVFGSIDPGASRPELVVVDLSEGTSEHHAVPTSGWLSRPRISADGAWLYYSAQPGATRSLYRLHLVDEAEPEEFISLDRHLHDPLLSPDGQWLAFRRNTEIWLTHLDDPQAESGSEEIRRVSLEGGENFTFTADGTALLYAAGDKVWRQPILGGQRVEVPIRLDILSASPAPVLLRHVRVLDFTRGEFGSETSLYVERGRIRWIDSEREEELSDDVIILDAEGRFAIPGLFDMHAHANAKAWSRADFQEAWLAYGVTSVREAGNDLAFSVNLADRGQASADPVPRYFFSGNLCCGELGALPWESFPTAASFQLTDVADVRFYVERWKVRGVHFIKTHPCLAWPLQRALADEARRLELPVMEHGNWHEWLIRSVTLGSGFVEHFDAYYDDVLQMLAAAGTGWSPTLALSLADRAILEPGRRTDPKLESFAIEGLLEHQQSHYAEVDQRMWREERSKQLSVIGAAYRRGVRLYAGTDAPYGPVPGASLHRELRSFANAGIPPLQVLRIATQEAASAVGAAEHLGTLQVGKLADIVLLDANPPGASSRVVG
jgi:imidazolonepropionase-like amidohydrolase/Tol biopolymer transport system component